MFYALKFPGGWQIRQALERGAGVDRLIASSDQFQGASSLEKWAASRSGNYVAVVAREGYQSTLHVVRTTRSSRRSSVQFHGRSICWSGETLEWVDNSEGEHKLMRWDAETARAVVAVRSPRPLSLVDSDPEYGTAVIEADGDGRDARLFLIDERGHWNERVADDPLSARFGTHGSLVVVARTADGCTKFLEYTPAGGLHREITYGKPASDLFAYFLVRDAILIAVRSGAAISPRELHWGGIELPIAGGGFAAMAVDERAAKVWLTAIQERSYQQLEMTRTKRGWDSEVRWTGPSGHEELPRETLHFVASDGAEMRISVENLPKAGELPKPTVLNVYGGFGIPMTLGGRYDMDVWAKAGGAHGIVHVRGGGEGGAEWHAQGAGRNKVRAVLDLVEAAEWLIETGRVRASQLAVSGASNGGLVAAAAAIRRPELFRACVVRHPVVDPTDPMPESAEIWRREYGSPADPEDLQAIRAYAPLSNIRSGVEYPAFLIMIGSKDTRVDPSHGRRLYEALAKSTSSPTQTHPVVLRESRNGDHFGPGADDVEWHLDRLSLLGDWLGI